MVKPPMATMAASLMVVMMATLGARSTESAWPPKGPPMHTILAMLMVRMRMMLVMLLLLMIMVMMMAMLCDDGGLDETVMSMMVVHMMMVMVMGCGDGGSSTDGGDVDGGDDGGGAARALPGPPTLSALALH
eukprot:1059480-Pyramimonas_sp.AAC.1